MTWSDIVKLGIYTVLVVFPLVYNLVKYVKLAMGAKNWKPILSLLMELMGTAENMYDTGAARKEWVMSMIASAVKAMGMQVDFDTIGELIDNLCKMSKEVNAQTEETA